jgi:hypothetical protein
MASSTSVPVRARLTLPGRDGAVLARLREGVGEGRRERMREGEKRDSEVRGRAMDGCSIVKDEAQDLLSSVPEPIAGVPKVPMVVPERRRSFEELLFSLPVLLRREAEPTGLR